MTSADGPRARVLVAARRAARQELHLRSPGSEPDMLLLHHALLRSGHWKKT